jgi:hypothetical protein
MKSAPGTSSSLLGGQVAERLGHRARQFLGALRTTSADADVDERLSQLLDNREQVALLMRLSPFDRAHHLKVHDTLVNWGCRDPDLLQAALLHDIGKADGRGRVRVHDRVLYVVLQWTTPRLLGRLTAPPGRRFLHGLYLARNHARLGAQLAADAGASPRCYALIAAHETRRPGDQALVLLQLADHGAGG